MSISSETNARIKLLEEDFVQNQANHYAIALFVKQFENELYHKIFSSGILRNVEPNDLECIKIPNINASEAQTNWRKGYQDLVINKINLKLENERLRKDWKTQIEFQKYYEKELEKARKVSDKWDVLQKMKKTADSWFVQSTTQGFAEPFLTSFRITQLGKVLDVKLEEILEMTFSEKDAQYLQEVNKSSKELKSISKEHTKISTAIIADLTSKIEMACQILTLYKCTQKQLVTHGEKALSRFNKQRQEIDRKISDIYKQFSSSEKESSYEKLCELYQSCIKVQVQFREILPQIQLFLEHFEQNIERIRHEQLISEVAWEILKNFSVSIENENNNNSSSVEAKHLKLLPKEFFFLGKLLLQKQSFRDLFQQAKKVFILFQDQFIDEKKENPNYAFLMSKIYTKIQTLQKPSKQEID